MYFLLFTGEINGLLDDSDDSKEEISEKSLSNNEYSTSRHHNNAISMMPR